MVNPGSIILLVLGIVNLKFQTQEMSISLCFWRILRRLFLFLLLSFLWGWTEVFSWSPGGVWPPVYPRVWHWPWTRSIVTIPVIALPVSGVLRNYHYINTTVCCHSAALRLSPGTCSISSLLLLWGGEMRRAACGGHWSQGGLTGSHQSPPVLPPVSQPQPRAFTGFLFRG